MLIPKSGDISLLQLQATFDISVTVPVVRLANLSVGPHLANVQYAFSLYSPSNVALLEDVITSPTITGVWDSLTLDAELPVFDNAVEFSGFPYMIKVTIKDSAGNLYSSPLQPVEIPPPYGNKCAGGNFGEGQLHVRIDCSGREALIKDVTPYQYQGAAGIPVTDNSSITVLQPAIADQPAPAPVVYEGYSNVAFPLNVSGRGHQAILRSVRDFLINRWDNAHAFETVVRIKYTKVQPFNVYCNLNLCPLMERYRVVLESAEISCSDKDYRKILRLNSLMMQLALVDIDPTCSIDVSAILDKINELMGWDCNCYSDEPQGLNGSAVGSAGSGVPNYSFNTAGDLTAGTPTVTGNNVLFTLKDYKYIFQIAAGANNRAFTVPAPTLNATTRTKTFVLNVDLEMLTEDILGTIGGSTELMNMFNQLIKGQFQFSVDGKCVVANSPAYDYTLSIGPIPASPLSAVFKTITIGAVEYGINLSFSTTTGLNMLQSSLNGLQKGVFTVAVEQGVLMVRSFSNTNRISGAKVYGAGSATDQDMALARSGGTGTTTFTPSQIVQGIIDYLCVINASQIRLGYDFVFTTINADGTLGSVNFKQTDSLKMWIDAVNLNATRAIPVGSGDTTFQTILAIFADKTSTIRNTDVLFGTRDGHPGQLTRRDVAQFLIDEVKGSNDSGFLSDWCVAVNRCSTSNCKPVTAAMLELRTITKDDFYFVGNDLWFAGKNTNANVPASITINLEQRLSNGGTGGTIPITGQIIMPAGTNILASAANSLPVLGFGRQWVVISISGQPSSKLLALTIVNNGAPQYKVGIRMQGSSAPFNYATYTAQAGYQTVIEYALASQNYEASVIAVCGVGSESASLTVSNIGCPAPLSYNAVLSGTNFLLSYAFPPSVTEFQVMIDYPNGGNYAHIFAVDSTGQVSVAAPADVDGDYSLQIRALCDEGAGWYGPASAAIVINIDNAVSYPQPTSIEITNVQATTATVTATAPSVDPHASGVTLILTPVAGGAPVLTAHAPTNLVWNLTGLTPATQYNVKVRYDYPGGISSAPLDGGNFTTQSGVIAPPVITTQPTGGDYPRTLTVVATGTGLHYAWYKDNVAITGNDQASYQATAQGTYRVDVSNGGGLVSSNNVTVTTPPPPTHYVNYAIVDTPVTNSTVVQAMATAPLADSGQIVMNNQSASFSLTLGINSRVLIIAEPSTEPVKTSFTNGPVQTENIPDYTFATPYVNNGVRYYFFRDIRSLDGAYPSVFNS